MTVYLVTDPDSGRKVKLTGDSPPSEDELEEIFLSLENKSNTEQLRLSTINQANLDSLLPTQNLSFEQEQKKESGPVMGALEAGASMVSGAVAEPVAGIAGVLQSLNPMADAGAGAEAVSSVRNALTFEPPSTAGKEALASVGETLEPLTSAFSRAEDFLGENTLDITGSPALAAAAKTLPTAILEAVGLGTARKVVRSKQKASFIDDLEESAPTVVDLERTSRAIYKEIEDLGGEVDPISFRGLVSQSMNSAKKAGASRRTTPMAFGVIQDLSDVMARRTPVSIDEILDIRTSANLVARNKMDPAQQGPALAIVDEIDNFLDQPDSDLFNLPEGSPNIAKRHKAARELWGRAKRSSMIDDAMDEARNQASGFENGIRIAFRKIVNNPKKRKFFKKGEIDQMRLVVQGSTEANIAKLLGRFSPMEGQSINALNSAVGAGASYSIFGPSGVLILPAIGLVSRKLAQKLTAQNAKFANLIIRAGSDGVEITKAYLNNVKKADRSATELSQLLMRQDIDVSKVAKMKGMALVKDALDLRRKNIVELSTVAALEIPPEETD